MAPYRPKKRLGQHFLNSPKDITRIVEVIDPRPDDTIIEIGPGKGILTIPLVESGAKVIAIEFDDSLVKYLIKTFKGKKNIRILNMDFLQFEADEKLGQFKLAGNLPYNITSPILDWCLRYRNRVSRICFTVQKEIAERLSATPGNKNWSPISIFMQLHFDIKYHFKIPAGDFKPPPKVDSAVIELLPENKYDVENWALFEKVVRQSFRQRRKLLLNNLVPEVVDDVERLRKLFDKLGFSHKVRAEELSIIDFLKLTQSLSSFIV